MVHTFKMPFNSKSTALLISQTYINTQTHTYYDAFHHITYNKDLLSIVHAYGHFLILRTVIRCISAV